MSQLYVWCPADHMVEHAEARFQRALDNQQRLYTSAFGRDFRTLSKRVGGVWIGQLQTDEGVLEWSPWMESGVRGVAWSGVCENHLGRASPVEAIVRTAFDEPADVAEWHGSFAFAAWDVSSERVAIVTATTQPQTLWRTEGPGGWAIGSRARPLLACVGRRPELDEVQATLFLAFGYLAGDGSLFRGVERLPARSRVLVQRYDSVRHDDYISLPEYFARGDTQGMDFDRAVEHTAERYASRVAVQLRHSRDPLISLTGGRDSRSIAAALARAGYSGSAQTGGAHDSLDVVLAGRVAHALGFEHHHGSSDTDTLDILLEHMDRAKLWSTLSEGIETIRHALHFSRFFESPDAPEGSMTQTFNGLKPGLNRPFVPDQDALVAKIVPSLHAFEEAREHFAEILERLAQSSRASGGGPSDWRELYFWQRWALHWGQDNVAAKFGLVFWWTPLMDKNLIRASWWLPDEKKSSNAFIEALTAALAPELLEIRYDSYELGALARLWKRVKRRLPALLQNSPAPTFHVGAGRRARWSQLLFEREPRVWAGLVEEDQVRRVMDMNPNAHLLWSLATLELFAEACLDGANTELL